MEPISRDVRVRDTVPPERAVADSPGRHPTRRRPRSCWVPGEWPRRPMAGARSTLRRALGLDDFLYLPEVLYVIILVWLIFSGPGRYSLDGLIARRAGWP